MPRHSFPQPGLDRSEQFIRRGAAVATLGLHLGLAMWLWQRAVDPPMVPPPELGEQAGANDDALSVVFIHSVRTRAELLPVPDLPRPPQRPQSTPAVAPPQATAVEEIREPRPQADSGTPAASMPPALAVIEPNPLAPAELAAAAPAPASAPPRPPLSRRARQAQDAYLRELMAWLLRHRVYPDQAKKDKAQGVVQVRFSIDRSGHVLASAVHRGIGYPPLEQAALDVLARADPLPPLPRSLPMQKLTVTLPIEFSLRTE